MAAGTGDIERETLPRGVSIRSLTPADFMALCRYDWSPLVSERDTVYLFITQDHARYCFAAFSAPDSSRFTSVRSLVMSAGLSKNP